MPGYAQAVINQDATIAIQSGNKITISEKAGEQWGEYASSNPAQGTHEWVGLVIDTGEKDITKVTFMVSFLLKRMLRKLQVLMLVLVSLFFGLRRMILHLILGISYLVLKARKTLQLLLKLLMVNKMGGGRLTFAHFLFGR
jgi:hypothetical protein